MKKAALILAALTTLAACKQTLHDSGCITRFSGPDYPSTLNAKQQDTIDILFNNNGLSMAGYYFTSYFSTTIKDSAGDPVYYQMVSASVTLNGLPIFNSIKSWYFHNGVWYKPNDNPIHYPYPGSDTTGHQTLPALRSLFFKTMEASLYNNKNFPPYPKLGRPGYYYRDSCFYAQLGYMDASYQPGSSLGGGQKLVKLWRVSPVHDIPFIAAYRAVGPIVYVIDSTGVAWTQYLYYPGTPIPFD